MNTHESANAAALNKQTVGYICPECGFVEKDRKRLLRCPRCGRDCRK